jgi:DNA (cytosine-5)-methyltransferase 1
VKVIDFFCGSGGASKGLEQAGFEIALGLDIDENSQATYQMNFPKAQFINKDIRRVETEEVLEIVKVNNAPLLITACAPCQPFSKQNNSKSEKDERRTLLDETHRFILALNPEYIMLENVPGMQNVDSKIEGPFCRFTDFLTTNGYHFIKFIAKSEEYGVPQRRKRLVILASRLGEMCEPKRTHGDKLLEFRTVRDAIGHFTPIAAGTVCQQDPVHRTPQLNPRNLERIKNTPEGGDRRNWPEHLINECHKNYAGHTDTYGRMSWDELAPTLTTKCHSYSNGRFGHPDVSQNRAISLREAASLQTFPDDFQFFGGSGSMARQIGNAVPCELARQFGLSIIEHHNNNVQDGQI